MRPELIAHRGASRERRENTLPAFARALELGADGIELDVHVTHDGVVVVHHDFAVTAAEPPNPAIGGLINELSAADVASFKFRDGSGIPTLREVMDLAGDRTTLYVELKGRGIEKQVVECLAQGKGRYAIHSFDHSAVKRARGLARGMATGILLSSYLVDPAAALQAAEARDYWQSGDMVDRNLVHRIHAAGGRVIVWTVNRREHFDLLAELGVDAICTDDVRVAQAPQDGGK